MDKIIVKLFLGLGFSLLSMALGWSYLMNLVLRQLIVTPNSIAYKIWSDIPVPIYLDLYVYDWVNAREFEKNPEMRPIFREVGPFVYEEVHARVNVSWSENGSIVAFNQTRTWKFVPEQSANVSVMVTNLNAISMTVGFMGRLWESALYKQIVNVLLNKYESLFVTAPAENWLFKGITHELLEHVNLLRNLTYIPIPYEKFGWFYDRNGSALFDGRFEMRTGTTDMYEIGNLVRWNDMSKTEYYMDECAEIKGSAGELMAPVKKFQKHITAFSPDLCSYMSLNEKGAITVEGVEGILYEGDEMAFDNGQLYPENRCFCCGECSPTGARNVSACKIGAPAFVSFPHFYKADPSYRERIDIEEPDRDKHSFQIKLDPVGRKAVTSNERIHQLRHIQLQRTGIALEVQAGIQVNFLLRPYDWLDLYKNQPKVYVPMLWFKQRARISPELSLLVKLLHFAMDGSTMLFCLAEVIFLILFFFMIFRKKREGFDVSSLKTSQAEKNRYRLMDYN